MSSRLRVVLIAEESAGARTFDLLRCAGHDVVAVLASQTASNSSGASVFLAASRSGIAAWPAELVRNGNLAEKLKAEDVDLILNVHSLYIIHHDILRVPRIGAFNLHPGPLPRYAGLNAVSWAIYHGETSHGVTLHRIVPEIDAGPIAYQAVFPIEPNDTALSLSAKCVREGLTLIRKLLDAASHDPSSIPALSQEMSERHYYSRQVPDNGRLIWHWPAEKITRFVRACDYYPFHSPWGYPITDLNGIEMSIARAVRTGLRCHVQPGTVGEVRGTSVLVASGDEWVAVERIKVGKDFLPPTQVLHTRHHLGRHEEEAQTSSR